ncbi:MAG: Crp/Fnr family transcriptional regulator [Flavobacteriales bacterium]
MSDDFQFLKFLNSDFVPTPEIINEFEGAIQVKEIKRKQLLQRKGDTHSKAYFVRKGLLKSYVLDEKGKEHIFMFAPENWIVTDINSVTNYGQTELFIQAIEDSEVEVIQGDAFMKLTHKLQSNSQLEVQKLLKRNAVLQKRIISLMSKSAIERYEDFIATYPGIVQRVPQKLIASYLGITPQALSKTISQSYKK